MTNHWQLDVPAVVDRRHPEPTRLKQGRDGHPCARCQGFALFEWSPGKYRACSAYCLSLQGPPQHIVNAVRERHKIDLTKTIGT